MTSKAEQKNNTRQHILQASIACFAEKGYSGCSVADIMERAGVSKGCIYVHFKSKEELFRAIINAEFLKCLERIELAAIKPPYLDGVIWFLKECIHNTCFPMDHRLWAEITAVAAREKSIREIFIASESRTRKFFVELLNKAAEAGEIDLSPDFNSLSICLFSLGSGLIARAAYDPEFDFRKQDRIFEIFVRRALGTAKK